VLLGLFAGLAAVLAAVGIYGVIAYVVGRRTSEIGLRMALGATPGGITRLVIGEAMSPVTLGLAIGLGVSAVASRALTSLLFGVQPLDPVTFVGVAATLAAIAAAACYLPARSASTVDPADALRDI
jgi:putative ABC transport system permease protein|tara:strand:- start:336 stop:713 length:378 start_codon:yes stop_codon:yes gene_type:complete